MTTNELLEIIRSALEAPRKITTEDTADSVEGWDSLGQLAILVAIDKKLGGQAAGIKDLAQCQSVRSIQEVLHKYRLLLD